MPSRSSLRLRLRARCERRPSACRTGPTGLAPPVSGRPGAFGNQADPPARRSISSITTSGNRIVSGRPGADSKTEPDRPAWREHQTARRTARAGNRLTGPIQRAGNLPRSDPPARWPSEPTSREPLLQKFNRRRTRKASASSTRFCARIGRFMLGNCRGLVGSFRASEKRLAASSIDDRQSMFCDPPFQADNAMLSSTPN
jgi:hypothetical protein